MFRRTIHCTFIRAVYFSKVFHSKWFLFPIYNLNYYGHLNQIKQTSTNLSLIQYLIELLYTFLKRFICTPNRNRTCTAITGQGILSPSCLPIPPSGHCFQRTFYFANIQINIIYSKIFSIFLINILLESDFHQPPQAIMPPRNTGL